MRGAGAGVDRLTLVAEVDGVGPGAEIDAAGLGPATTVVEIIAVSIEVDGPVDCAGVVNLGSGRLAGNRRIGRGPQAEHDVAIDRAAVGQVQYGPTAGVFVDRVLGGDRAGVGDAEDGDRAVDFDPVGRPRAGGHRNGAAVRD